MKYQWILFDADETLFYFDSFAGLQRMFSNYGVDFGKKEFEDYERVNRPLWVEYQNGSITAQQLQETRFDTWAKKVGVAPKEMNDAFMLAMAEISQPLPGAKSLLDDLYGKVKIGMVTNGFKELQQLRLDTTGFTHYFDIYVISEEVGAAKPDNRIFEHTFSLMENDTPLSDILMVGDNPHSDVLGGMNVGIDTCWLNQNSEPCPEGITPTYTVNTLMELHQVLLSN